MIQSPSTPGRLSGAASHLFSVALVGPFLLAACLNGLAYASQEGSDQEGDPAEEVQEQDLAPAQAEEPSAQPAPQGVPAGLSWEERLTRDARLSFSIYRSRGVLAALEDQGSTPARRAAALVALGTAGLVSERQRLESWVVDGGPLERQAALLGLGELGRAGFDLLGPDAEVLMAECLKDPDIEIAETALLGLLRTGHRRWQEHASTLIADPDHRLSRASGHLLVFQHNPIASHEERSSALLLELRWEAARTHGMVDGQAWSTVMIMELAQDEAFLDAVILLSAARLSRPAVKDHLLSIFLPNPSDSVLRAAVRRMPRVIEKLIAHRKWTPANDEQWRILVDESVEERNSALMPMTLEKAMDQPAVAVTAAGQLVRSRPAALRVILSGLRSPDEATRVRACEALMHGAQHEQTGILRSLSTDTSPNVRAMALVARMVLGDARAAVEVGAGLRNFDNPDRPALFSAMLRHYRMGYVAVAMDRVLVDLEGVEYAQFNACLFLRGRLTDLNAVRTVFDDLDLETPGGLLCLRALGHYPTGTDMEFLVDRFPFEGKAAANEEVALCLVRGSNDAIRPVIQSAIWRGPWNRSVLAAALVENFAGLRLLFDWIDKPPARATTEDIRRLGFSIGEWGGLNGLEQLMTRLRSRKDHPAVEGALLGLLTARTR